LDQVGKARLFKCKFVSIEIEGVAREGWMTFSFNWPYSELPEMPREAQAPPPDSCGILPYPKESLRNEETGTVTGSFLISVEGKVIDKKILRSSGFKALDAATLEGLAKCQFKPALLGGVPHQEWVNIHYSWTLE
jgi:TonB family protein